MEGGQSSLFGEYSSPQKRFVDKDGFAFPAPGGLHKEKVKPRNQQVKNIEVQEEKQFLQFEDSSQYFDLAPEFESTNNNNNNAAHHELVNHVETPPSDKGAAGQQDSGGRSDVQNLMSNLMQETSDLQTEWMKIFSQSEEFEMNCLEKLTAYTDHAKKLETNLDRQRNTLCHRIRGIGGILQNFE